MNWLKSKLFNKSEIAKQLGLTPTMFRHKLLNIKHNRFTDKDLAELEKVKTMIIKSLEG